MQCLRFFIAVALVFWGMFSGFAHAQSRSAPRQQQQPTDASELQAFAEKGDVDAQFELGLRLLTGEGLTKNEKEGVKWIQKAANQKHLKAQFVMGSLYEDGVGVEKDEAKAVEWYLKSAENGFAPGQQAVAMAYDMGRGVPKNPATAIQWLQKAADQNHPPALTALGAKLERGVGAPRSPSKAALYYLRAAQQDYVPAMNRLAAMYYTGLGVPVDYRRAGAWYQRAARSDDPWAINNLAWFLATCPDETLHNGEQAVIFASRALRIMDEAGEEQRYEMLDTKAAALARNGEFLEAVLWQKKALAQLPKDKDLPEEERKSLENEFQTRLKLYQKQTPYADPENPPESEGAPLPQDTILQEEPLPGGNPPNKKKPRNKGTVVNAGPSLI